MASRQPEGKEEEEEEEEVDSEHKSNSHPNYASVKFCTQLRLPVFVSYQRPLTKGEEGSLWYCSDEEVDHTSYRDRDWQKSCERHHALGYHDGLMAGMDASAQEGFNIGFKESVLVGYNWGLVRGVASALACLPNDLKERLIETKERRDQFQRLHESVHSLSTTDALHLFHADIKRKESVVQSNHTKASSSAAVLENSSSNCSRLENYIGELESLLLEHPTIKSHLSVT